METGDWVVGSTPDKGEIAGFIVALGSFVSTVCVTNPPEKVGVWRVANMDLSAAPHEMIPEDIAALIDISLAMRDEAWFNELTRMLKRNEEVTQ